MLKNIYELSQCLLAGFIMGSASMIMLGFLLSSFYVLGTIAGMFLFTFFLVIVPFVLIRMEIKDK